MSAAEHLLAADLLLAEGSLYERLRREPAVAFDAEIAHAGFVYDDHARGVLERTHREYLDIGQAHRLPMLTVTDTWRASRARQDRSPFRDLPVNQENVRFLRDLRASYGAGAAPIVIGGSIGPYGDAYQANTSALSPEELVGRSDIVGDGPDELAVAICEVRDRFGLRAIGGCCGTGTEHIAAIARACAPAGGGQG